MLRAGVLLDENAVPVKPGIHARGPAVSNVTADLEKTCEYFLLELLIQQLADITDHDRTALAHALLKVSPSQRSRDDLMDDIDRLFYDLRERIFENGEGILTVDKDAEAFKSARGHLIPNVTPTLGVPTQPAFGWSLP
jgi:hypothetical protein